jgi:hypothetical protein
MSTVHVTLPDSLHHQLEELARREGVSLGQFIVLAAAEKLSVLLTEEYFAARAKRGTRERYEVALGQIPDVEPEEYDRKPEKRDNAG